jgi:hypothetical protein
MSERCAFEEQRSASCAHAYACYKALLAIYVVHCSNHICDNRLLPVGETINSQDADGGFHRIVALRLAASLAGKICELRRNQWPKFRGKPQFKFRPGIYTETNYELTGTITLLRPIIGPQSGFEMTGGQL